MDEQKLTYEQFKEDILQWKNTHREEYNRFSRLMTNGDERQYLAICKAIFRQLPGIRREWELSWNDDSTDGLANINMQFAENADTRADRGAVQETEGGKQSSARQRSAGHILGQDKVLFQW